MIAKINCSECGHDKGHTLEHVGHDMLAECTNCDHVNDVISSPKYPISKQTLTDFYNDEL